MPGGRQGAPGFDPRRLKSARAAASLTQGALAAAANVHENEVKEWESGRRVPQVGALAALARALHISPLDLLDRDADEALTLQQLRAAAGLSQQRTAERAGLLRTTYSQIERGETGALSARDADAIGRALGVRAAEIRAAHAASRTARARRPTPDD